MKTANFRIKNKPNAFIQDKANSRVIYEPMTFNDNLTDPGTDDYYNLKSTIGDGNNAPTQSAKFDGFIHQIGGVNSLPYKLDQKFLNRLQSQGLNVTNLGVQDQAHHPLSEYLQVKSVPLSNVDISKKPKNNDVRMNLNEERVHKVSRKAKKNTIPSLTDQEVGDDNIKKTKTSELKHLKGIDSIALPNTSLTKSSSIKEKNLKSENEFGSSLTHLKDTTSNSTRNLKGRRSESQSPSQDKRLRNQIEATLQRSDRRHTSTTPRKNSEKSSTQKFDPSASGRFGPLEKIKEITAKKNTPSYVSHFNGASNNNKPINQLRTIQAKASTNPLDNMAKTLLNNKGTFASSVINPIHTIMRNGINSNGPSPVKGNFTPNNPFANHNNNPQAQNQLRNSKIFTGFTTNSYAPQGYNSTPNTLQQQTTATNSTSNSVLPSLSNPSGSNLTSQNVSAIITNTSSLIPRSMNNYIRQEEIPKKKIVYVPPPQSNKMKFFVGGGNNGGLVKRVLAKRDWWEETEFFNTLFNFKWQQTYRGYRYDRLPDRLGAKQLVNHFEYHTEISTKDHLIKNLTHYCESNKIHMSEITPLTFCFNMDDLAHFDKDMQKFAKFFIKIHPDQSKYQQPSDKRQATWFNFDYRKKAAYQMAHSTEEKKPSQYIKPVLHNTFLKKANAWVLKPTGFNRGRGIEVFNSLEDLNELLNDTFAPTNTKKKAKKEDENASGSEDEEEDLLKKELSVKSRTFVIQKYIEDVMLINRRKFDIRVWVLVTQEMQLYFFKEGYLRTSSEEFTLADDGVFNKFIHLTNNAVQKFSNNYGQEEAGNQLSFKDFEEYMKANGLEGDFRGKILPRMKELVKLSMLSVGKQLNQNDRKYCFEIFGYDFMIDGEFNPWLIEVNTNPCIEESSPLLGQLIPRMIDDAFKMTLDVIFPKPYKKQNGQNGQSAQKNPAPAAPAQEEKKIILDIAQTPLRSALKPLTESTPIVSQKQLTPKSEEEGSQNKSPSETGASSENAQTTTGERKDSKEGAADLTSRSELLTTRAVEMEKSKQNVPEELVLKAPEGRKEMTSPERTGKGEEETTAPAGASKGVVFSVDGYSDTENMWEHLCSLQLPKSPTKRDNKGR